MTVLRDLAAIAQPHGVTLAFEFLGFAWCSVRTPRGVHEIIQKTERTNVGINFDACHFFAGGGQYRRDRRTSTRRGFIPSTSMIWKTYPKKPSSIVERLIPGRGIIPLDEICRRLKGIGYDGRVCHRTVPPGILGMGSIRSGGCKPARQVLRSFHRHFAVR